MKIIFLDVDGVLNYEDHMRNEYNEGRSTSSYHMKLDPSKIQLLKELIDFTGGIIVVSSSWRIGGFEKSRAIQNLTQQLNSNGIIINGFTSLDPNRNRGKEIAKWIYTNCASMPESFVILDDDKDMGDFEEDQCVFTSWKSGLTKLDIEKAKEILLRPISKKAINYIIKESSKVKDILNIEVDSSFGEIKFQPTSFLTDCGDNGNLFFLLLIKHKDDSDEELSIWKKKVGDSIHNQLKGNNDYINSSILLNLDDEEYPDSVTLYVFEDCETEINVKIV